MTTYKMYINGQEWPNAWEMDVICPFTVDKIPEIHLKLEETASQPAPAPTMHDVHCHGPDCEQETFTISAPAGWYSLGGPHHLAAAAAHYFCSLRCLANWLAGELAKEESSR